MIRFIFSGFFAALLIPAASVGGEQSSESITRPPNFVIIFVDDLGYADVGCYGAEVIRTPHIDRLAAEGMRFTSFYAQAICGPSRAALMTGCYPMRVAEVGNVKRTHPALHPDEITIAEILKTRGYATACFGKWDLAAHRQRGFFAETMPNHQGFDYFFGTPTSNDGFVDLFQNAERIEVQADMGALTERYTDEAIAFIERNRDLPFFVYIPHTMAHTRLAVSEPFLNRSERGLYGDVVEEIDANVGRLMTTLEDLELTDRTYVLFTSDNGPWLIKNQDHQDGSLPTDHGGSAGELRSGKVSTWEGGFRVPCIWWAPGRIAQGVTCPELASTLDVLPTLAALAYAETPDDRVIDGEDINYLLASRFDEANDDKVFYYYLRTVLQAVRQGRWKLHLASPTGSTVRGPHGANHHIHPDDDRPLTSPLLFDLETDIGETHNVSETHPEIVLRLIALAEEARADIGDYNRVGENMRFFDPLEERPTTLPTE